MTMRLQNRRPPPRRAAASDLSVALVNNMPDAARRLRSGNLPASSRASRGELSVRVDLYALSRVPRSVETRVAMAARYGDLDDLIAATPDALIVTGASRARPTSPMSRIGPNSTRLIDWARSGAVAAALYSCLAAHAAVRIADGVRRAATRQAVRRLCRRGGAKA